MLLCNELGLEMSNFPAELNRAATFRCVKVSAMEDPEEQFAYQTAVNIGGHIFKGILYDQGPENRYGGSGGGGESSSGGITLQQQQHQHGVMLPAATTTSDLMGTVGISGGNAVDPMANLGTTTTTSVYATPINAFLAGTQFFPPPRS